MEKIKCKSRLVAREFEEREKDMNTDAPTCAPEALKVCRQNCRNGMEYPIFGYKDNLPSRR